MPCSRAAEFRHNCAMRWLKNAIRGMLARLGYTVLSTAAYDAMSKEREELFRRVTRDSGLDKLLGTTGGGADPHDYQTMMASHSIKVGYDDLEPEFRPLMNSVRAYTMTSVERMYLLYKSAEYLARARIAGDMLECGVWKGGSMMLLASTLLSLGDKERTLYLFDTYEGHPKPASAHDVDLWGNRAMDQWADLRKTDETSDWAKVSIEEVRDNMARTGYPMDKVKLVKGMVEKTAASNVPRALSLLRLDTDWYESAKVGLETFWPRLVKGGLLIIDDYGHYQGQRKAVDEFFAERPQLLHRVDYGCRVIVKIEEAAGAPAAAAPA